MVPLDRGRELVVGEDSGVAPYESAILDRCHVGGVGRVEVVGLGALDQLRGEGLRSGVVECGREIVLALDPHSDLVERRLQRGSREDRDVGWRPTAAHQRTRPGGTNSPTQLVNTRKATTERSRLHTVTLQV